MQTLEPLGDADAELVTKVSENPDDLALKGGASTGTRNPSSSPQLFSSLTHTKQNGPPPEPRQPGSVLKGECRQQDLAYLRQHNVYCTKQNKTVLLLASSGQPTLAAALAHLP